MGETEDMSQGIISLSKYLKNYDTFVNTAPEL